MSVHNLEDSGTLTTGNAIRESWNIQEHASSLGFDWPDVEGVLDKVGEELFEIRAALEAGDVPHARKELGDLLMATVNLARFLETCPEHELHHASLRFTARFVALQQEVADSGKTIQSCTLDELDEVWERVKLRTAKGLESAS